MNCVSKLTTLQEAVNIALDRRLPSPGTRPAHLHHAIRHSIEAGGKRLRPILVLAAHELFPSSNDPMPAAVSVEFLHTYSLIHDDLPAMDDSDLRRGEPSCHKAFDEATAILAGDALLAMSFEVLAVGYASSPSLVARLVRILAVAAGSEKLVAGQMEDLMSEGEDPDADVLSYVHQNKTAALLVACMEMGLSLGEREGDDDVLAQGRRAGLSLGLAFQAMDDFLDATRTTEEIGKDANSDAARKNATLVALRGLEETRELASRYTDDALTAVRELGGDNEFLLALILYLLDRQK